MVTSTLNASPPLRTMDGNSPGHTSRLTGKAVPDFYLHAHSRHFRDTNGRTILLRGVNLSSSAKSPRGHPQHVSQGFWESAERDGLHDPSPPGSDFSSPSRSLLSQSIDSAAPFSQSPSKTSGITYVDQTLDLRDGSADIHLARLRLWGFNCVRFVTVWEALEHRGPGQYDFEYMDYVVQVLRKCKEHGFRVFMDPHQDLFSRFCGGSGAPLWTLYACGLNPRNFTATGAAFLQSEWPTPDHPDPENFPAMIWATNYDRLACQTLNTMFWAGRDFAPRCIIDGVNIQDYLQSHYLEAYRRLGRKILDAGDLLDSTVIGWDSLNEPNHGYVGLQNVGAIPSEVPLQIGPTPTAIQGMRLGMGRSAKVENYRFGPLGPQRAGNVVIDPKGKLAWVDPKAEPDGLSGYGWRRDPGWKLGTCIWAQHGVWDTRSGKILKPDYFRRRPTATSPSTPQKSKLSCCEKPKDVADFASDYWRPHLDAYCHMIREIHPEAILFVHPPVFKIPPELSPEVLPILKHRSVFSSHFYDGLTLVTKSWNWFNADALGILRGKYPCIAFGLKIGETAIRKCMRSQLAMLRQDGLQKMGEFPMMMGEIGIPYDLDKKKAYKDGDYRSQIKAMDASLNACDGENMLNYTIWAYCPSNCHQWGDLWNGEDLSLWSLDDEHYQGTNYTERSNRLKKVMGRPNIYNYGSSINLQSLAQVNKSTSGVALPNSSDVTLINQPPTGLDYTQLIASDDRGVTELAMKSQAYKHLNDGARALAAFCRPFPIATVGTPVYFNFDIGSASFEMTVEVECEDENRYSQDGKLATEIYVPAAHFGSVPVDLNDAVGEEGEGEPRRRKFENDLNQLGRSETTDPTKQMNDSSELSLPYLRRVESGGDKSKGKSDGQEGVGGLQVEVEVSIGRWEIEGQIIKWYYPTKAYRNTNQTSKLRSRNPNRHRDRSEVGDEAANAEEALECSGRNSSEEITSSSSNNNNNHKALAKNRLGSDSSTTKTFWIKVKRRPGPILLDGSHQQKQGIWLTLLQELKVFWIILKAWFGLA